MKVITEERLIEFIHNVGEDSQVNCSYLLKLLEEIDTLTVSKLRPMVDANDFAGDIQVFYSADYRESEIYYYNKASQRHFDIDSQPLFWDDDYTIGFVPAIIYKPELTGDGE